MTILGFKADRDCVKCGSHDIAIQYDEKHNHLRKICKVCGFHWLEYPKDHKMQNEHFERSKSPA